MPKSPRRVDWNAVMDSRPFLCVRVISWACLVVMGVHLLHLAVS